MFNALTGFRRRVANFPGTTVELARGPIRGARRALELLDLPGTYSLAARSPDEAIVSGALAGRLPGLPPPDVVVAIVDAANAARNLYLVSQLLERGRPCVVALNMIDLASRRGIELDAGKLAERLGCPVVPVCAINDATIPPLVAAIEAAAGTHPPAPRIDWPAALATACDALRPGLPRAFAAADALRVLLDRDGHAEQAYLAAGGERGPLESARAQLATSGVDGAAAEVRARYAWCTRMLDGVVRRPAQRLVTWSDRLDQVLTHPIGGAAVLVLVLTAVFQTLFTVGDWLMGWMEAGFGLLAEAVGSLLSAGVIQSLVVDGLIGGVGGVLVFLPQIMLLFLFIALLEDCGYMARAAFMMDRVMRTLGLSGRAFIPLLSSFACAIPGIMGTRIIGDRRERFVTILLAPFMSCSARLPVYTLMIAAFVPAITIWGGWVGVQGLTMLAMYVVGVLVAIPIAWLLKRTAARGGLPFLMELPSYKWPRLRAVWQRMYEAGGSFVIRAGTVILLVNLVVWALAYFPRDPATEAAVRAAAAAAGWNEELTGQAVAGAYLRESALGRMGRALEPAIEPIGWDWRIGMAVLASFPAREVVIGTLGTIFNLSAEETAEGAASAPLRAALASARWHDSGAPLFTLPVALSLMVFFALCAQCTSTLVIMGRELASWKWPIVSFVGMTAIAYAAALGVASGARALGW